MSELQSQSIPATRRPLRVIALGTLTIFAAYVIAGYLIVPGLLKSKIVELVENQTGVTPSIEDLVLNPFRLRASIVGFSLPDPRGTIPLISFSELIVDVRLLGFFSADLALEELTLSEPRFSAEFDEAGELNLAQLFSNSGSSAEEVSNADRATSEPASGETLIIDIDRFRIERGEILFRDRRRNPRFEVGIAPLDLDVAGFTTRSGETSPYSLVVRLGETTELAWEGTLGIDPLRSTGKVDLRRFDLAIASEYLSEVLRFGVRRGQIDFVADYDVQLVDGLNLVVSNGALGLAELHVVDRADDDVVLELPSIAVRAIEFRVGTKGLASFTAEEVVIDGGALRTRLESDGSLHLANLFMPLTPESDLDVNPADEPYVSAPGQPKADALSSALRIDRFRVKDFEIAFEDRTTVRPVEIQLSTIQLKIDDYQSRPGSTVVVDLQARLNEEGEVQIRGPLQLDPLDVQLTIDLAKIALRDFQPYLQKSAKLQVRTGSLSGAILARVSDASATGRAITAAGRLQVDNLSTIDQNSARKFLDWKTLRVEGIDLTPDHLQLAEIALDGVSVGVILGSNGQLNIAEIFDTDVQAESEAPREGAALTKEKALAIRIDRITLDDSALHFSDLSATPNFTLGVTSVVGTIEGLSSDELARANVDLKGRIDDVSPLTIVGQINPLSSDAFTDLSVVVDGVSMPTFAPYSGRFVGYSIDRGKLDLNLNYQLSDRSLRGKNTIVLDQFSFGEAVESDEATSLPVPLVVALMRDSAGKIEIELPIRGNLDDPSFSILGLVGKALVNLIVKTAASPFALIGELGELGGLIGGAGANLAQVEFQAGSNEITPTAGLELRILAKALSERPALRLEIQGRADPDVDGPALRAAHIEQELQRSAFQSQSRSERKRLGLPQALILNLDDRLRELEKLYATRQGGEPGSLAPAEDEVGLARGDAHVDERIDMRVNEKNQRAHAILNTLALQVELADADWRALAKARASAVQTALVVSSNIETERLFLVDVEVGAVASEGAVTTQLSLTAK